MALRDLQAAGSNAYVARLEERGLSGTEILYDLRRRFPGETDRTYYAALSQGRQAAAAAEVLGPGGEGSTRPASIVPTSGGPPGGYRYYARAELNVPGRLGTVIRQVEVDSAGPLTAAQLQADVLAAFQGQAAQSERGYQEDRVARQITIATDAGGNALWHLVAVERGIA